MDIEKLVEDGARAKAYHHFNRRQWFGCCPKEARTLWLVDKYWRQFVPDARAVLAIALAAAAEEAEKRAEEWPECEKAVYDHSTGVTECSLYPRDCLCNERMEAAGDLAKHYRTLATQLGAANG